MTAANTAADRSADHHRRRILSSRPVAIFGELADDLIERGKNEVGELNLRDRTQAIERHTDRGADDSALGERRVDRAIRAELFVESFGCAKDAAEFTNVFTEN